MVNKEFKNIILIIGIIILYFLIDYFFSIDNRHENNIILEQTIDGYQINIYNNHGEIKLSQIYPQEPSINELTKDIVAITISTGSSSSYRAYEGWEGRFYSK